jgi:hypothetical protein
VWWSSSRHLSRQAIKPGAIGPETPLDPQTPAAIVWAWEATFLKAATGTLTAFGIRGMLTAGRCKR